MDEINSKIGMMIGNYCIHIIFMSNIIYNFFVKGETPRNYYLQCEKVKE
jgi:hypothetical protein